MIKHIISVLPLVFIFLSSVEAQIQTRDMTLKQAVQYALEENTNIKRQNLAIAQSRYRVQETRSQGLPQITGSAQFTDNLILQEQLLPGEIFGQPGTFLPVKFGVQYSIPLSARWDQLIYNKAYKTAIKQSLKAEQISKVQQEQIHQEIIYQVATSYYQSIIVREQQHIIEANLQKLAQSVNVAQVQYDNQMIRKIDLDQLKVNLANTQSDLDNSAVSFSQSLDMMKILMGYNLLDTLILTDQIADLDFSLPENSVTDNPVLSLFEKQLDLKSLEIKSIQDKFFPTLSGFAQYGYQTQFDKFKSDQMNWTGSAVVGLSLQIPIFDGFQKKRQISQRKLEEQSIGYEMEYVENQLNQQYLNATRRYRQNEKTVEIQKSNYELAQQVYDAVQTNYKNGLASLSDLINADSGIKGAQTQYLTALLQSKIAALDVLSANGNMNDLLN